MIGLGTIMNVVAIIVGGTIGLFLKENLKDRYKVIIIQTMGLATLLLGLLGTIEGMIKITDDGTITIVFVFEMIFSLVIGGLIGAFLQVEDRVNNLGLYIQNKLFKDKGNFAKGFVHSSLLFCIGAMAITGAIQDGMKGNYSILFTKSILDGFFAATLASTLGIGVVFSFVPVLLYQGSITIAAYFVGDFLINDVITLMSIVGNILIIGIGLSILEIKKIKVADMLPSIFISVAIYYFIQYLF